MFRAAVALHVTPGTIYNWVEGVTRPTPDHITLLAAFLGCPRETVEAHYYPPLREEKKDEHQPAPSQAS